MSHSVGGLLSSAQGPWSVSSSGSAAQWQCDKETGVAKVPFFLPIYLHHSQPSPSPPRGIFEENLMEKYFGKYYGGKVLSVFCKIDFFFFFTLYCVDQNKSVSVIPTGKAFSQQGLKCDLGHCSREYFTIYSTHLWNKWPCSIVNLCICFTKLNRSYEFPSLEHVLTNP